MILFYIIECGGIYTSRQGSINHNGYPGNYLPNQDCTYTIDAPANKRIVLYFQRFELEQSSNCRNDYLRISEGLDDDKRHVGRFCGRNRPKTLRTDKGIIEIRFVSNYYIQDGGFKANYYFEDIQKPTETLTTASTTTRDSPGMQIMK